MSSSLSSNSILSAIGEVLRFGSSSWLKLCLGFRKDLVIFFVCRVVCVWGCAGVWGGGALGVWGVVGVYMCVFCSIHLNLFTSIIIL